LPSPGSPHADGHNDNKGWQQRPSGRNEYPGMGRGQIEIAEVHGTSRAVEAPTAEK
jgi:hypothetical protein